MRAQRRKIRCLFALLSILFLSGCNATTGTWNPFEKNYRPLEAGVAEVAAPLPAGVDAGDAVVCSVSLGTAKLGGAWRPFATTEFTLPPAARVTVTLAQKNGKGTLDFQAWYNKTSQQLVFCPVIDGPPDKKIKCAAIYTLPEDLDLGIKRTFDIPQAVEGGELTCAHSRKNLRK